MLERHGVELVLHGHVHRNDVERRARTTVFATASASNADLRGGRRAAYRVVEVSTAAAGDWQLVATLRSLAPGGGTSVTDSTRWSLPLLG